MRMLVRLSCIAAALLALSGCMQRRFSIKVNMDGSGVLEVVSTSNKETHELSRAMAGAAVELGLGLKEALERKKIENAKKEKARKAVESMDMVESKEKNARAANFGEGVAFVSVDRLDDGAHEGVRAVYKFSDIRKLKLPGSSAFPMTKDDDRDDRKSFEYVFEFEQLKSGNARLRVRLLETPAANSKQENTKEDEKKASLEDEGDQAELLIKLFTTPPLSDLEERIEIQTTRPIVWVSEGKADDRRFVVKYLKLEELGKAVEPLLGRIKNKNMLDAEDWEPFLKNWNEAGLVGFSDVRLEFGDAKPSAAQQNPPAEPVKAKPPEYPLAPQGME
ncbi:MAG: hypothetical protein KIS92_04815 [Planctomycetota bacterium]|nr:hypothetical protein [Planctomycetota bacterium]